MSRIKGVSSPFFIERDKINPDSPFDNYFLEWNTPNDTISSLWRNTSNWKALFPRN